MKKITIWLVVAAILVTMAFMGVACKATTTTTAAAAETTAAAAETTTTTAAAETTSAGNKKIVLGLPMPYIGQEFWADVETGAKQKAAEYPDVELIVTASHEDAVKQTAQVEAFIAQKVDVILLPAVDTTAMIPAVEEAMKAGIPVVLVGRDMETEYTAIALSSHKDIGIKAGEFIAKILNGKGNVFLFAYPQDSACVQRIEGIKEVIAKNPGLKIVGEEAAKLPPDTTAQAENILTAYKNIDAFFAVADVLAIPSWRVAKEQGRKEIIFVGVDGTKEALDAIKEDSGYAGSVAQQPVKNGADCIELALKIAKGEPFDKLVNVPVTLISKENIDQYVK